MSEWADPYEALSDEQIGAAWARAEAIADQLELDGWICGHPGRGDVEQVLRAAIYSGHIRSHADSDA